MKLGFIGLGRMGQAMVINLLEKGVDVVGYNRSSVKTDELKLKVKSEKLKVQVKNQKYGEFTGIYSVEDLVSKLTPPRIVWLMVPHGDPVDQVIDNLTGNMTGNTKVSNLSHPQGVTGRTPRDTNSAKASLEMGDIIIDGGNSFYKDSIRRYKQLKKLGIHFLDVGTSGGLEGARYGACLMVGGDRKAYNEVQPRCRAIAGSKGIVTYFGPSGAGHFVKMVHNGVEYAMLQALGEGFEILAKGPYKLELSKVADNWSHGSVVRGWLTELLEKAFKDDPNLSKVKGIIGGGSTGRWTVEIAKELGVETPVIQDSLKARKTSQTKQTFASKIVAILRYMFGGHEEI